MHANRNRLLFAFLTPIANRHPSKPVAKSRMPNISIPSFDTANSSSRTEIWRWLSVSTKASTTAA